MSENKKDYENLSDLNAEKNLSDEKILDINFETIETKLDLEEIPTESEDLESDENNKYEEINQEDPQEDYDFDEFDDNNFKLEEPIKTNPKTNKFLNMITISALALCFGLIGGFVGSNLTQGNIVEASNPSTMQNYKIDTTLISDKNVATLNDVSDIVNNTMPSIVSITATIEETLNFGLGYQVFETPSSGSGVIYSQNEKELFIITNYHVVEEAKDVNIGWVDGTTTPAIVQGFSKNNDIALLKVKLADIKDTTLEKLKVAIIGDSDKCDVGEGTIAIGNALGYGQTVTDGIVSALNREVSFEDGVTITMLQTSAAINPGNSGGALLNAKGELIGINSAKYSDTAVEGIGYAIPINTVVQVISDIVEGKTESETYQGVILGITAFDITQDMAYAYKMPLGVCIQFVETDSLADVFGLLPGDIITQIDDQIITSMTKLKQHLEQTNPGDTIKITIQRPTNNNYEEQVIEILS